MKKIVLAVLSILSTTTSFTQSMDLDHFNQQRRRINKNGLLVISSWSAGNIIYSSIAAKHASGSAKYFHKMNASWNAVTLGLTAFGCLAAKKDDGLQFGQTLRKQASIEKIFLFNVGLDVAYVVGGIYLKERAKSSSIPEKLQGYGKSVVLQGAALLLFDAIMFQLHSSHGKELYRGADKLKLAATENGVGLLLKI